jgi:outer membrane lipoprotein-sorting protein
MTENRMRLGGKRVAGVWLGAILALGSTLAARADDAEAILQKTRDAYVALKSYADSGTVTYEFGVDGRDQHTFETYFTRAPRHFLFDFHKQGGDRYVIWGDPEAFHTWWKTTGSQTDYPNPNNIPAITLSTEPTKGSAMKIPTLLYGKSSLAAVMLALHDPELEGVEEIDHHRCHKVVGRASDVYAATGKEVNIHRVTVWIDAETFLVRRMREEYKALPGSVSRTTTSFHPTANPTLNEARFKFSPPSS